MDLYRFFDADDRLLYVGISLHAAHRASEHGDKPWWPDVERMNVEHLEASNRREAEVFEREVIIAEKPVHNVVWNQQPVSKPVAARLEWACQLCGGLIKDGDGYVELPNRERTRHARETSEWEAEHPWPASGFRCLPVSELEKLPREPHWWAIHRGCDPRPEEDGYWFDVGRIRSLAEVIDWTAHLMEKNWFHETDWSRLLYRINRLGQPACTGRPSLGAMS